MQKTLRIQKKLHIFFYELLITIFWKHFMIMKVSFIDGTEDNDSAHLIGLYCFFHNLLPLLFSKLVDKQIMEATEEFVKISQGGFLEC